MAKRILLRPLVTEKATKMTDKLNQYGFVVNKDANKIEIRKAIEEAYNVNVESINTLIIPAKAKSQTRKGRVYHGRRSAYKKAFVTVAEGEVINIYGEV